MDPKEPLKAATTALISSVQVSSFEAAHQPGLLRVWPLDRLPELIGLTVDEPVTVGRDESCDVVLDEESVSRRHATLRPIGTAVEITDLESSNGTFINDRALKGTSIVMPRELVRFGRCTFVVVEQTSRYEGWWTEGAVGPIVGGPTMEVVRQKVLRFATMSDSVLVTGETGTGKEVIAGELHRASGREGAFVAINCSAVPDRLFEDQFFGHTRGAFTGAERAELGFFRAAKGGSIFLDEIGELEPASQPKLLRALEAHEVIPLGATKPEPIDVRVIAATNRDLSKAVSTGAFRADLYSRIRVLAITLPPLRERLEDVLLLMRHFSDSLSLPVSEVSHDAVLALIDYDWPGNARELRNVLVEASAAATAEQTSTIELRHLRPELVTGAHEETPSRQPSADDRTSKVLEALRRHEGNVAHVADELGLHRAQIYKVLRAAQVKAASFRGD